MRILQLIQFNDLVIGSPIFEQFSCFAIGYCCILVRKYRDLDRVFRIVNILKEFLTYLSIEDDAFMHA